MFQRQNSDIYFGFVLFFSIWSNSCTAEKSRFRASDSNTCAPPHTHSEFTDLSTFCRWRFFFLSRSVRTFVRSVFLSLCLCLSLYLCVSSFYLSVSVCPYICAFGLSISLSLSVSHSSFFCLIIVRVVVM
jgi:hypothetical protein